MDGTSCMQSQRTSQRSRAAATNHMQPTHKRSTPSNNVHIGNAKVDRIRPPPHGQNCPSTLRLNKHIPWFEFEERSDYEVY
jgi:hypothetical protein